MSNELFEQEVKSSLKAINGKLDTYIKHQKETCTLLRKPLEEHVKDGLHFRDKLVKLGESLRINWVLTLLLISGAVGGFFYLLRGLK